MIYRSLNDRYRTKIYVSDGCKKITGYNPEDLIGNNKICFNDLIPKEYRSFVQRTWLKKLKAKESVRIEYPITTADGKLNGF
jgi:PAS domain S-box-containing protein